MLRLFGGILTLLSGVLIGYFAGQKQKDKLEKQELLYNYLDCLCCELKYYSSPLEQIAKRLLQRTAFVNFNFADVCAEALENTPFSLQFEARFWQLFLFLPHFLWYIKFYLFFF